MTRNNRSADVDEFLAGFHRGVPGAWLRTETLYRGYVRWNSERGSARTADLPLVAFARAVAAYCPSLLARHRRKGVPLRGWKLWPGVGRQDFLDCLSE